MGYVVGGGAGIWGLRWSGEEIYEGEEGEWEDVGEEEGGGFGWGREGWMWKRGGVVSWERMLLKKYLR